MNHLRHSLVKTLAILPFCILTLLSKHLHTWDTYHDGWSIWLDAHYYRYCRFDMALWGWNRW